MFARLGGIGARGEPSPVEDGQGEAEAGGPDARAALEQPGEGAAFAPIWATGAAPE